MNKIFVLVSNGEAEVRSDTVPEGMIVEIIDLDIIRCGESFPSKEAFDYCRDHKIFEDRRRKQTTKEGGNRFEDPSEAA